MSQIWSGRPLDLTDARGIQCPPQLRRPTIQPIKNTVLYLHHHKRLYSIYVRHRREKRKHAQKPLVQVVACLHCTYGQGGTAVTRVNKRKHEFCDLQQNPNSAWAWACPIIKQQLCQRFREVRMRSPKDRVGIYRSMLLYRTP
jgi:hypothetical protein